MGFFHSFWSGQGHLADCEMVTDRWRVKWWQKEMSLVFIKVLSGMERPGGDWTPRRDKDRGTPFLYWLVSTVTCQCWCENLVGCEWKRSPYYLRITTKQRLFHPDAGRRQGTDWYDRDKIWSRLASWVKSQIWWFDLAGASIAPPQTALTLSSQCFRSKD